jgi:hypothetical protein
MNCLGVQLRHPWPRFDLLLDHLIMPDVRSCCGNDSDSF